MSWPYGGGDLTRTPTERLDLQPGELVEVKSNEEILATLNGRMNRGLGFSPEMVKFCGQRFRVDGRISQIIEPDISRAGDPDAIRRHPVYLDTVDAIWRALKQYLD